MAFDVDVDPDAVSETAKYMGQNRDQVIGRLEALLTAVTILLAEDGGLYLKQASPVMAENFVLFSQQLSGAINGIQNFADNFNATVKNLVDLDLGYSKDPEENNGSVDSVVEAPTRTPG